MVPLIKQILDIACEVATIKTLLIEKGTFSHENFDKIKGELWDALKPKSKE